MRGINTDNQPLYRTILINPNQPNLNLKTAPSPYPKDYMSKITDMNTQNKTENIQNKHDIK